MLAPGTDSFAIDVSLGATRQKELSVAMQAIVLAVDIALVLLASKGIARLARVVAGLRSSRPLIRLRNDRPSRGDGDPDRCLAQPKRATTASKLGIASAALADRLLPVLAIHILRELAPPEAARPDRLWLLPERQVRQAIGFMRANLKEDLSLNDIAEAVGLSVYHFARAFRAAVGVPPHQYLIQLRISRARELLAGSDLAQRLQQFGCVAGRLDRTHARRRRGNRADWGIFRGLGHNGIATNWAFTLAGPSALYNLKFHNMAKFANNTI